MSQPKNLPFPVGFTNTRTFKKIRVDFPAAAGIGAAVLLIDFAAAQPNHEFYFEDLEFLSKDFDVSRKILEDIVLSYDLFEVYEKDEKKVVSPFIIKQLEPYYKAVEDGKLGGEISSTKRKIKQKQQLLELHNKLSEVDSIQGGLEYPTSTPLPYNKLNKLNKEKEKIKKEFAKLKTLSGLNAQEKSQLNLDDLNFESFTIKVLEQNKGLINVLESLEISTYDNYYLKELEKAYI